MSRHCSASASPDVYWRVTWRTATGGAPQTVVAVKSGEFAYGPPLLPDGRTVLFTLESVGSLDNAKIVVRALQSGEQKMLIDGGNDASYLPTGHIVYVVGGVLFAVPFNPQRLEVTGGPVPIVEGVQRVSRSASSLAIAQFTFSDNGWLGAFGCPTMTGAITVDT